MRCSVSVCRGALGCASASLCMHTSVFLIACSQLTPMPLAAHLNSSLPFPTAMTQMTHID